MQPTPAERERFEALFRSHAPRVQAYASRHTDRQHVEEVVAETFLIAWRRRDRLAERDPLPWLLVTARHVIANTRRRSARLTARDRLETLASAVPAIDGPVVDRAAALAALAALTELEREAVLLVAWDGLDASSAAAVAGCSTRAFTVRLHRARLRLGRELDGADPPVRAMPLTPTGRPMEQTS